MSEGDRIAFILERDGMEAAVEFARRGIKLYRSFSMKAHVHRAKMIESCIYYHKFLKSNGR
jgi:hypothetical protein